MPVCQLGLEGDPVVPGRDVLSERGEMALDTSGPADTLRGRRVREAVGKVGPRFVMLGLSAVVVLAGSALPRVEVDAAGSPRDYEVVSLDVNGDPTAYAAFGSWIGNNQLFSHSSVSSDGAHVVWSKTNGLPSDLGYSPLADDEFCSANGGCQDIYVRDLVARSTDSVLSHLIVSGAHPNSNPTVGYGGTWASSADANTFVFTWTCWSDGNHVEVIGGTTFCTDGAGTDEAALVVVDRDTDFNKVLRTSRFGDAARFIDVSANGDAVLFDSFEAAAFTGPCFRPNWDCDINDPGAEQVIALWERGAPPRSIVSTVGYVRSGGQDAGSWEVEQARVSGDGSTMALVVRVVDWSDVFAPPGYELFLYAVGSGSFRQITLPASDHPGAHWAVVGVSHTGHRVALAVGAGGNGALYSVDTGPRTVSRVTGVVCEGQVWSQSMTADGRYVGCWRGNDRVGGAPLPPVVVDLDTGVTTELGTGAEGFDPTNSYRGPVLAGDGSVALILHHRSPEDDVPGATGNAYPLQLRVTPLAGDVVPSTPCDYLTPTLQGNGADNVLVGTPGDDVIFGGGGHDEIRGNGGDDLLCGGDGNDTLIGGSGNDMLFGGPGDDLVKAQRGNDRSYGGPGDDRIQEGPGADYLDGGSGRDKLWGAIGDDTLVGGDGNDQLHGDPGNDVIDGGPGTDRAWGDAGADSIFGGDNSDSLYGGIGVDVMRGGAGNDRLYGWTENDELYGDGGRDQLRGQAGDDLVDGGAAYDYCSVETVWLNCEASL